MITVAHLGGIWAHVMIIVEVVADPTIVEIKVVVVEIMVMIEEEILVEEEYEAMIEEEGGVLIGMMRTKFLQPEDADHFEVMINMKIVHRPAVVVVGLGVVQADIVMEEEGVPIDLVVITNAVNLLEVVHAVL